MHQRVCGTVTVLATMVLASVWPWAPSAGADLAALSSAVTQARAGTPCPQLQSHPLVQRASEIANRSNDDYLNHTARSAPVGEAAPGVPVPVLGATEVLKDLGFDAKKTKLLSGAGRTEVDAIKFILVSGFASIPDCSYTKFGVSSLLNEKTGYYLTTVILAEA